MTSRNVETIESFARDSSRGYKTITSKQYHPSGSVNERSLCFFVTRTILSSLMDTRVPATEHSIRHFQGVDTDMEAFKKIAFSSDYGINRIIGINVPVLAAAISPEQATERILASASPRAGRPNELVVAVTSPDLSAEAAAQSERMIDAFRELPTDHFRVALLGQVAVVTA